MATPGIVGLPVWDHGQKNGQDVEYCRIDPEFYEKELASRLAKLQPYLGAIEIQQEAHYQSENVRTWSKLDLPGVPGFRTLMAQNRFMAIHARTQDVDISDFENEHSRSWSVRETCGAIDFACKLNADAVVLHPGTYSLKTGRFWPRPDEAQALTNNRKAALIKSLGEIVEHFVERVHALEAELDAFRTAFPSLVDELERLFVALDRTTRDDRERVRTLAEIFRVWEAYKVPPSILRQCRNPGKGLSLALENVEPPNFLCCTPRQMVEWHSRLTEIYQQACDRTGFTGTARTRHQPYLALDPNHLLNSKVILIQPTNKAVGHIFEDYDDLSLPYITLPCDIPFGPNGRVTEPLLNRFLREHSSKVLYSRLAGAQRMDSSMTTHDPIKAFRTKMFVQTGDDGLPCPQYSTSAFDPEVELNLEEVVQVLGFDKTYILELHDHPDELLASSFVHTVEYLSYLATECANTRATLRKRLESVEAQGKAAGATEDQRKAAALVGQISERIDQGRFYVRPHRTARGLWKVGYDEAGFYQYDERFTRGEPVHPVEIYATLKLDGKRCWFKPFDGLTLP